MSQRFGIQAQKPAAPGLKPQESISYSDISATSSAVIKGQQYDNTSKNDDFARGTPLSVKSKLSNSNLGQNFSSANKGIGIPNIEIAKDNIYLKGGSSLADALNAQQKNNGLSIAMRMKKNREAATGGVQPV